MLNLRRCTLPALLAAALAITPTAQAQINLSTGLSAGGAALAEGASDPFWSISTIGNAYTPQSAVVLYDADNATCHCGILANAPTGQWISDVAQVNNGWGVGPTVFASRTFDLTGYNLLSVTLTGNFSVMDGNIGLFLNGFLIPGTTVFFPPNLPWQYLTSFSTGSGFNAGLNTLEFRSNSSNAMWDGVMLRDTWVNGNQLNTVPEPASIALLGSGLLGMAIVARRRQSR
jgi:hypothetical protein